MFKIQNLGDKYSLPRDFDQNWFWFWCRLLCPTNSIYYIDSHNGSKSDLRSDQIDVMQDFIATSYYAIEYFMRKCNWRERWGHVTIYISKSVIEYHIMFKVLTVLASLIGVSAFAPVSQRPVSSSLKMAFENELGAQAPLGFWDPLGFLDDADQEDFDK